MPKINKIKSYLIVVVLFACLEVTCASFYPYILSYLIDNYKTLTINKIIIISILFLLSVILILLFAYLKKLFIAKYKKLVITKLKEVCFESIIKSDYSKFHEHSFDFYSSFIVNDIPKIYSSYYENLCYGFIRLFCNIVYLIILCFISWQMAIVLFVSSILIFIVPKVTGKKYGQYQLDLSTKNAALLEKTNEYFQSHDFINDNNIKLFLDKYKKELDINKESEYKFDRYNSFAQIFTGASLYIQMVIVFSIGLIFSYYGFITIGILSSSLIFTDLLSGQMNDVAYILLEIKSSKALRDKYQVMVNYPTRKSNVCLDSINTINLKSVCYNINKELSYKKLNIKFEYPKKYAIIGSNGSGKSTLSKLICKVISPISGEILYNEQNYSNAKRISYISQERYIFDGSIIDNISMLDKNYEDHKLIQSYMKEFNLNKDPLENVGRNGVKLSGGEIAKICLIRELIRKPNFIILDEPFTAINHNSIFDIENKIYNSSISIIEVTHDLSKEKLSKFDEIIFIKNAEIIKIYNSSLNLDDFIDYVRENN